MITVSQLIEILEQLPPDHVVVMSSDAEGNKISPFDDFGDDSVYVPATTRYGDVYPSELTDEMRESGFGEEDLWHGDGGIPAVVLYPVN